MVNFYLHSVGVTGKIEDINKSIKDLEGILETGAILNRRYRNLIGFGFNGTKYVSLSDYDKRFDNAYKNDEYYFDNTAYAMYSTKALSIMIDKAKVKVIVPKLVSPLDMSPMSMLRMYGAAFDLIERRMSDLPDEVQVKGNIYDDSFMGITIPSEEIVTKLSADKLRSVYVRLKELIEKYKYQLGLYNLSDMRPMDSEEDVEEIIKRSL